MDLLLARLNMERRERGKAELDWNRIAKKKTAAKRGKQRNYSLNKQCCTLACLRQLIHRVVLCTLSKVKIEVELSSPIARPKRGHTE